MQNVFVEVNMTQDTKKYLVVPISYTYSIGHFIQKIESSILSIFLLTMELPYKHSLPDDVLQIIKEYAMPVTRPDWRTLHLMPYNLYKSEFYNLYHERRLYIQLINPNMEYSDYLQISKNYKPLFHRWYYDFLFG